MVRPQMAPQPQHAHPETMFEPGPPIHIEPAPQPVTPQPQPQPVQAQPQQTQDPVLQTIPEEELTDTGSTINAAVLEYLNSAYTSGKDPATLVAELKGLQAMGVIEEADLAQIKDVPEEQVLHAVMSAAETHNAGNLLTPDAQMYLSNIYRALQ